MTGPPYTPETIESLLVQLSIPVTRHDHAPVFTCDEERAAVPESGAARTKNLFLRDKRGRRHVLLVTLCEKTVAIRDVVTVIDADTLSFASPERMMRFLGVTPGSVTLLGLANDAGHGVELLIDRDVWTAPRIHAHPLTNAATLVLAHDDLVRFLDHTGHAPRIVSV
jgi:Ala-tRNA(Pro) deacylase